MKVEEEEEEGLDFPETEEWQDELEMRGCRLSRAPGKT